MGFMSILVQQVVIMFLLMLIGFILFRTKKLGVQGSKELGNILVYVDHARGGDQCLYDRV